MESRMIEAAADVNPDDKSLFIYIFIDRKGLFVILYKKYYYFQQNIDKIVQMS